MNVKWIKSAKNIKCKNGQLTHADFTIQVITAFASTHSSRRITAAEVLNVGVRTEKTPVARSVLRYTGVGQIYHQENTDVGKTIKKQNYKHINVFVMAICTSVNANAVVGGTLNRDNLY